MREPVLEPVLRKWRLRKILPLVREYPRCTLLDIGCGWEAKLLRQLEPNVARAVGIDFKAPELNTAKLTTVSAVLEDRLPFDDESFDVVTMLAVLEHLAHPKEIVLEMERVLRPGGAVILTVPSPRAKPVLEFVSFRLGLINPSEIRDHKQYYNRSDLYTLFDGGPWTDLTHRHFQLGMNNLFAARLKPSI